MRWSRVIIGVIIFSILTIITQVGGLIFLFSASTYGLIEKKFSRRWTQIAGKAFSFLLIYSVFLFLVVPPLAKSFGRVPLPFSRVNGVQPGTLLTVILCRNYVRPELKDALLSVSVQINLKRPGTVINYLDGNFPFINKFPLLPHLSHNDGKKLDISFLYLDKATNKETNDIPSPIGYGICEEPVTGETNTPEVCARKGYWQYNLLKAIIPQNARNKFVFDGERTTILVNLFTDKQSIGKVFIEPHLKDRLGLKSNKIRFHGCQAVRHDDHLHVQLK